MHHVRGRHREDETLVASSHGNKRLEFDVIADGGNVVGVVNDWRAGAYCLFVCGIGTSHAGCEVGSVPGEPGLTKGVSCSQDASAPNLRWKSYGAGNEVVVAVIRVLHHVGRIPDSNRGDISGQSGGD